MLSQPALFHETLNDALRELVQALGGAKKVGATMRPEKTVAEAARWLLDCLNADRREKLDPDQVLWLLRQGRTIGCHVALNYLCAESGYAPPAPAEPADELTQLQREYIAAVKVLSGLTPKIEQAQAKLAAVK